MKSAWPRPHDPEHLFAKALLIHGPLPPKGWSITRNADGSARYVVVRGRDARRFQNRVVKMFTAEVQCRYAVRGWSEHHCQQVARSWKNMFLLWVWEKIDEA